MEKEPHPDKPQRQTLRVAFDYSLHFTERVFSSTNPLLKRLLQEGGSSEAPLKILCAVDGGLLRHHPTLLRDIEDYLQKPFFLTAPSLTVPGGETSKNHLSTVKKILRAVDRHGLSRHSVLIGIGGGAALDSVGFAASLAHRGIRHLRLPTTVLSQGDSGVGVKNGVNLFGKKNFIGCFSPPMAVINDFSWLDTLPLRDIRCGLAEAVKVALIKDPEFFEQMESDAAALAAGDQIALRACVARSAKIHLEHIALSDPFERGSSRPLDFGHWSAHKLEQISRHRLKHGEAVAIGICLDVTYGHLTGTLSHKSWERILLLFQELGLPHFSPHLSSHLHKRRHDKNIFRGIDEFREHIGGRLTLLQLKDIGAPWEIHDIDESLYVRAIETLQNWRKN